MSQAVIEHRGAARDALNLAVVTVSDTRTLETDTSGAMIVALAEEAGHRVLDRHIIRDEPAEMNPLFRAFVPATTSTRSWSPGEPESARATRPMKPCRRCSPSRCPATASSFAC